MKEQLKEIISKAIGEDMEKTKEESDTEKIKDFFTYTMPTMTDIENGDILAEVKD